MKRLILLIALVLAAPISSIAQPVVKGVTIEGNEEDVTAKLMVAGLKYVGQKEEQGCRCLEGSFAGVDNCAFGVLYDKTTKDVYAVVISLPEHEDWIELKNEYNDLFLSYKAKYGKPLNCSTSFKSGYGVPGMEMHGVRTGLCDYYANWKKKGYEIGLIIDDNGAVAIGYYNTKAQTAIKKAISKDI